MALVQRRTLKPRLKAAGVQVHTGFPFGFSGRGILRPDLRNHRKLAVIDGRIGYTGSMNLVDPEFKQGLIYEELVVRVSGPVVLQLQYVFASDWYMETREILDQEQQLPEPIRMGYTPTQILPSGPDFSRRNNHRMFVALIHRRGNGWSLLHPILSRMNRCSRRSKLPCFEVSKCI